MAVKNGSWEGRPRDILNYWLKWTRVRTLVPTLDGSCFLLLFVPLGLRVMPSLAIIDSLYLLYRVLWSFSALNIWLLGLGIRLWLWPLDSELLSRDLSTGSWGKCQLIPLPLRSQPLLPSSSGERLTCGPDAARHTNACVPRWRRSRLPWTPESIFPQPQLDSYITSTVTSFEDISYWKHSSLTVRELHVSRAHSTPGILPRTRAEEIDQIKE